MNTDGSFARSVRNRLLSSLGEADVARLQPHLELVDVALRQTLESADRPIEQVFFFESGLASIVAKGPHPGKDIEIGIIGREGMTGLALLYGDDRSPNRTFVQAAGRAYRMSADKFRSVLDTSPTLMPLLLRFAKVFTVQTAETALANGRAHVDQRLARWLLMAHDRADGDLLTFTHEFLALMLGVRRPGVTTALRDLERKGLINAARGRLTIRNRAGLTKLAGGYYGLPEKELNRLLPSSVNSIAAKSDKR